MDETKAGASSHADGPSQGSPLHQGTIGANLVCAHISHASADARPKRRPAPLTFGFALGRHPLVRALFDRAEGILVRTLYRPLMRYLPPLVERVAVPIAGLPAALDGFTFVHLSDIHHSFIVPLAVIEHVVALTNGLQPRAVFVTGDYVTNSAAFAAPCARALAALRAPLGVYAILGNHDYWTDAAAVSRQLRENGIPVLLNEARPLVPGLWVAGVDDPWAGQPDLNKALAPIPADAGVILLAHEPDFADQVHDQRVVLQLSGHSHGGQIRLPILRRPLLPHLAWRYYEGLERAGNLWIYVNRGLGTMQPPLNFTCRPEVTVLRLAT